MLISLDIECDLLMEYYRMLCGEESCEGCKYYSSLKGSCNNDSNKVSLLGSVEDLLDRTLEPFRR